MTKKEITEYEYSSIREFSYTKFVSINMVSDWMNGIRDMLGLEQRTYNKVVQKAVIEILRKARKQGDIIWFRQHVDRTFSTTLQITIYGQVKTR